MIFISHSTKDKAHAIALRDKLLARGYTEKQIFLDSDADSGIQAGMKWEEALYSHLKDCEALIVLCSANLAGSKWCFAEIVYAKANGKAIFPVFIEDCTVDAITADHQAVFAWKEGDAAYERVFKALDECHLGPTDRFVWPLPGRGDDCPYPGLMAFDEELAGVYFGREKESRQLKEELTKMRSTGEPRLLMIMGGSGSGKSSLLKAGVLPLLRHKTAGGDWIVLPVLRHGGRPNGQETIFERLALNIAAAFPAASPCPGGWEAIRAILVQEDLQQAADGLRVVLGNLAIALGRGDATVLLPMDQFEEILAPGAGEMAERFLAFLKALFSGSNGKLLGIGTMRSDYLDLYERHPSAIAPPLFRDWRLGPFPKERIRDVILKPAQRVKVTVADDLLARLEYDTPSTEALPLLAFTLEKLYREGDAENDHKLDLSEYERLGGMEGSIQKCIERIVPPPLSSPPLDPNEAHGRPAPLSPEQRAALRESFVRHLVQLNDKGEAVRLVADWDKLPELAKPLLDQFVKERLLIRNEASDEADPARSRITVEVAHEAIFRCWEDLKGWLRTSADILRWRSDVRRDRANDKEGWTGLRPAQLAIAKEWPEKRKDELEDVEVKWIREGIAKQRRLQLIRLAVFVAIAAFAGVAFWQKKKADKSAGDALAAQGKAESAQQRAEAKEQDAIRAREEAEQQSRRNLAQRLAYESGNSLGREPRVAGIWAAEALRATEKDAGKILPEAQIAVNRVIAGTSGLAHQGNFRGGSDAVFDQSGSLVAAADYLGAVQIFDLSEQYPRSVKHFLQVQELPVLVGFDGSGKHLITHAANPDSHVANAMVWDLEKDRKYDVKGTPLLEGEDFECLGKSPDFKLLAAARAGEVRLYDLEHISERRIARTLKKQADDLISVLKFTRDGRLLLAGSRSGWVQIWDLQSEKPLPASCFLSRHSASRLGRETVVPIELIDISEDRSVLVVGSSTDTDLFARLWHLAELQPSGPPRLLQHEQSIGSVDFLRAPGSPLITTSMDGEVRRWDTREGGSPEPVVLTQPRNPADSPRVFRHINGSAIAPDEKSIAIANSDAVVRIVSLADPPVATLELRGDDSSPQCVRFSSDGKRLISLGDNAVRAWDYQGGLTTPRASSLIGTPNSDYVDCELCAGGTLAALITRDRVEFWQCNADGSGKLQFSVPSKIGQQEWPGGNVNLSGDGRWIVMQSEVTNESVVMSSDPDKRGGWFRIPVRTWTNAGESLFSPDSHWLFVEQGGSALLYDLEKEGSPPRIVGAPSGQADFFSSPQFSSDGKWLSAELWQRSRPNCACLWYLASGDAGPPAFEIKNFAAGRIVLSGDSSWAACSPDKSDDYLDSDSLPFRLVEPKKKAAGATTAVKLIPLHHESGRAGEPIELPGHELTPDLLVFSPDGRWLLTAASDILARDRPTRTRLWDLRNGNPGTRPVVLPQLDRYLRVAQFSPDAKFMVTIQGTDDYALLWRQNSNGEFSSIGRLRGPIPRLNHHWSVRFSADSTKVAISTTDDPTCYLWDLSSAGPLEAGVPLRGGSQAFRSIKFSGDSSRAYVMSSSESFLGGQQKRGTQVEVYDLGPSLRQMAGMQIFDSEEENMGDFRLMESTRMLFVVGRALQTVPILDRERMMVRLAACIGRNMSWGEWVRSGMSEPYHKTFDSLPVDSSVLAEMAQRLAAGEKKPAGCDVPQIIAWAAEADIPELGNEIAWALATRGEGELSLAAAELALKHFPDKPNFRDTRGVARGLSGDIKGAIDDLQFVVDHPPAELEESAIEHRKRWLAELRAGRNPFANGYPKD